MTWWSGRETTVKLGIINQSTFLGFAGGWLIDVSTKPTGSKWCPLKTVFFMHTFHLWFRKNSSIQHFSYWIVKFQWLTATLISIWFDVNDLVALVGFIVKASSSVCLCRKYFFWWHPICLLKSLFLPDHTINLNRWCYQNTSIRRVSRTIKRLFK